MDDKNSPSTPHTDQIFTLKSTIDRGSLPTSIYDDLKKIMVFWFPEHDERFQEFWFSPEYDSYIRATFYNTWRALSELKPEDLVKIVEDAPDKICAFMGIVVCLDQFTRNLNRTDDRTIYAKTDDLCLEFVEIMTQTYPIDTFCVRHRIFILLPYRHQRKTHLLNFVMTQIQVMEHELHKIRETSDPIVIKIRENIINRFKIATIKDYSKVIDTIKHYKNTNTDAEPGDSTTHLIPSYHNIHPNDVSRIRSILTHVLDDTCLKYSLLPIARYVELIKISGVYVETLSFVHRYNIKSVCISLSGGVDSMVLSYILCHLRADKHIDSLCAVHVDYGNRQVSRDEAASVESWCNYMNIPLITRRIEHIKRHDSTILTDVVDRSLYEVETKNIRFNLYRYAMKHYDATSIMLGHHRDDLSENVLMNVLRGGDILNLFTMKEHQNIDGVPISRPMLRLPKSDIYEIAHSHEIPYLKDTTPEDCFRGTVRKIVLPALEKIDPSVRLKINTIGNSSDQWSQVVSGNVINPIVSSVKKFRLGLFFEFKDSYKTMNMTAWQKVLSEIFHGNGVRMITNRNLVTFLKWLDNHPGFVRFSNDHMGMMYIDKVSDGKTETTTKYMIFVRTGIASHIQDLEYDDSKKVIPIKYVHDPKLSPLEVVFNGWTIKVEYITTSPATVSTDRTITDDEGREMFCSKISLTELMNGEFSFYYRTCNHWKRSAVDDSPTNANITYSMGCKESDNKRYFKGHPITRYTPFIHFGTQCSKCRTLKHCIVYKISYFYK